MHQTPTPSGCFHTAHPSPLPRSDLQSPSFFIQPLPAPVDTHLRLGSAKQWHGPSVQVCLHSSCCKLVAVLYSKALKLPLIMADLSASEGTSEGAGTFPLLQLPPRGPGPILIPFSLFSFLSYPLTEIFLVFQRYEVFCQHSVDIL